MKEIEARIDDSDLKDLVTDHGNFDFIMFATSWLLTMFTHDIEHFEGLQRLFDAILAGGSSFIYSVILAVIVENKAALIEYDDTSTATFVVFRTPLRYLNSMDHIELVV